MSQEDPGHGINQAVDTMMHPPVTTRTEPNHGDGASHGPAGPTQAGLPKGPRQKGDIFLWAHSFMFLVLGGAASVADAATRPIRRLFSALTRRGKHEKKD